MIVQLPFCHYHKAFQSSLDLQVRFDSSVGCIPHKHTHTLTYLIVITFRIIMRTVFSLFFLKYTIIVTFRILILALSIIAKPQYLCQYSANFRALKRLDTLSRMQYILLRYRLLYRSDIYRKSHTMCAEFSNLN